MEPDREIVMAEAVASLRTALMGRSGVAGAFRWCWYENPMFGAILFAESVRYRFGGHPDIAAITAFMKEVRTARNRESALSFPAREAEALIRAILGEMFFLELVPPSDFSYPEIAISVLVGLYEEGSIDWPEWEELLRKTEVVLAEGRRKSPQLAVAESDWFAVGLHDSPFAVLDDGSV